MMRTDWDLIIVGGGILGAATVWRASAEHPSWRIAWIEKNTFAGGCTASSGGLLLPIGATHRLRELAQRSLSILHQVELKIGSTRTRLHAYVLAPDLFHQQRQGQYLHRVPQRSNLPQALAANICLPAGEYVAGPWSISRVAPGPLVGRILEYVSKRGVWCRAGIAARGFSATAEGSVTLNCSAGLTLLTRRLVFTTGPWLAPSISGVIRTKRVAAVHLSGVVKPGSVAISFPRHQAFLIPEPDKGRWLLSFRSEDWDVSPNEERSNPTNEDLRAIAPLLCEYLSHWSGAVIGGQSSCDAYPEEGEPVIRKLAENASVLYVGGGSGSGIRIAFALAEDAIRALP